MPEMQQMVPGVNQWKRHRKWPLMEFYFWPLKCVGEEDLILFRRSEEYLRRHQEFSQYSGSGYIFQ